MTNLKDIEKRYELWTGFAPKGSLKHKKTEDTKLFYTNEIKDLLEGLKEEERFPAPNGNGYSVDLRIRKRNAKIDKLIKGDD